MASKRPSLEDTLLKVQGNRPTVRVIEADPEPNAVAPASTKKERAAVFREGKKRVMTPLTVADHRRLKRLSADTDMTMEELMVEAVADLFTKHGA